MSGQTSRASAKKQTGENPVKAGRAGPGRPKGLPNKTTQAVKDMITAALDKAGGVDYLVKQATLNPSAFMTLVGKVIPLQIAGDASQPIVHRIEIVGVKPK